MKTSTALLSCGALITSLLLSGCGSKSQPESKTADTAAAAPALPTPKLYDAEGWIYRAPVSTGIPKRLATAWTMSRS